MSNLPFVSIVIPCFNEENYIGRCLDSVIANDYPKDRLEVLVIDGMSEDSTWRIVEAYTLQHRFIRILKNPKRIQAAGLNIGISQAMGEIIMRMDAHATFEPTYIWKCVKVMYQFNADNVGGMWKIIPRRNTFIGKSIATSLSHPFGVGNAYYRFAKGIQPRWVDTVPFFCVKREWFKKIGPFNEDVGPTEDLEFNNRLRKVGGRILLEPNVISYYYARSDMRSFLKHNFRNGLWVILPFAYSNIMPVSWRHLVPLIFLASLIGSGVLVLLATIFKWVFLAILATYGSANLCSTLQIARKEQDFKYIIVMPFIFGALHFSYGLGSLWGVGKLLATPRFWTKICRPLGWFKEDTK